MTERTKKLKNHTYIKLFKPVGVNIFLHNVRKSHQNNILYSLCIFQHIKNNDYCEMNSYEINTSLKLKKNKN